MTARTDRLLSAVRFCLGVAALLGYARAVYLVAWGDVEGIDRVWVSMLLVALIFENLRRAYIEANQNEQEQRP